MCKVKTEATGFTECKDVLQLFSVLFPVILHKYHGIKQKENAWCVKKWSTHFEHLLEQAFIFLKDPPQKPRKKYFW
jgi:hypothetical protein